MTQRNWFRNSRFLAVLLKYFARVHIWVYRRTNGRLGARLLWFPAALLTTTGRKSGEPRTTPTLYLRDGESGVLRRSRKNPTWYLNLKTNPLVNVQIGDEQTQMSARDATDTERAQYWPSLMEMYPPYRGYREGRRPENPVGGV